MSELSDIRKGLEDLKTIVVDHIAATKVYRDNQSEIIRQHSKELWGNGEPGLKTHVDRLITNEEGRKWTIRAIVTATLAGITDRVFHILK